MKNGSWKSRNVWNVSERCWKSAVLWLCVQDSTLAWVLPEIPLSRRTKTSWRNSLKRIWATLGVGEVLEVQIPADTHTTSKATSTIQRCSRASLCWGAARLRAAITPTAPRTTRPALYSAARQRPTAPAPASKQILLWKRRAEKRINLT